MPRADYLSLRILIVALLLAGQQGCALFSEAENITGNAFAMRPIVPPRDQIELEVWYIDRPVGDPLTGDALWDEIDQISSIDVEEMFRLNLAGIRYGLTGSDLPTNLSALLSDREESAVQRTTYQQIPMTSGRPGQLEVANLRQPCRISIPSQEPREYSGVRCVFQVTARRILEGWVRLEFVPEIHHGEARIRPQAAGADWQMQQSQQIEPLYQHRFSLDLNLGEHVLIGAMGDANDSVGQHFFRGGDAEHGRERLIVVRVRGMEQISPVPVLDWSYSRQ